MGHSTIITKLYVYSNEAYLDGKKKIQHGWVSIWPYFYYPIQTLQNSLKEMQILNEI